VSACSCAVAEISRPCRLHQYRINGRSANHTLKQGVHELGIQRRRQQHQLIQRQKRLRGLWLRMCYGMFFIVPDSSAHKCPYLYTNKHIHKIISNPLLAHLPAHFFACKNIPAVNRFVYFLYDYKSALFIPRIKVLTLVFPMARRVYPIRCAADDADCLAYSSRYRYRPYC